MKDVMMPEVQNSTFTEFNVRQDKGKPSFIRLHDSVVKDLERLLVLGGNQPGILLGTIEESPSFTIAVEDSEPCANLEERVRTWNPRAGSAQKIVGCYQCHSRPEFGLDSTDRALFQRCFPKEARLLLQVKPPKARVGTAMFFLGQSGQLAAEQATVEFPFNLRELGAEEPPSAPIAVVPQPAVEAPPPPAPVAAKASSGMIWKLAVAGVAIIASVVGLSGLRVFDGQTTRPQPVQPAPKQPVVEKSAEAAPRKPPPTLAQTEQATPVPKPVVVTYKRIVTPPAGPTRAPQTVVADNATVGPPALSQPVTQTPVLPTVPEAQTPVAPAPPPPTLPALVNNVAKPTPPPGPLTPPRILRQTAPEVRDSVRRSIMGEVIVKVRANIDATGKVVSAESVSKGDPIAEAMAGSAIAAVKRWQFEPAQRGAEKVPGEVVLSFTFRK